MGKYNRKGRCSAPFVQLFDFITDSAAYLDLSGTAVKLLVELIKRSKGNNGFGHGKHDRGRMFLSERDAAQSIGVAKNTAAKAFSELIEHGFLQVVEKGHFDVKGRATTWRLTFQAYPHREMGPTNEWRHWVARRKECQAQEVTSVGSIFAPPSSRAPGVEPVPAPISPLSAQSADPNFEPHIYLPQGGHGSLTPAFSPAGDYAIQRSRFLGFSRGAVTVPIGRPAPS
jgi:hypothetical protein